MGRRALGVFVRVQRPYFAKRTLLPTWSAHARLSLSAPRETLRAQYMLHIEHLAQLYSSRSVPAGSILAMRNDGKTVAAKATSARSVAVPVSVAAS